MQGYFFASAVDELIYSTGDRLKERKNYSRGFSEWKKRKMFTIGGI